MPGSSPSFLIPPHPTEDLPSIYPSVPSLRPVSSAIKAYAITHNGLIKKLSHQHSRDTAGDGGTSGARFPFDSFPVPK